MPEPHAVALEYAPVVQDDAHRLIVRVWWATTLFATGLTGSLSVDLLEMVVRFGPSGLLTFDRLLSVLDWALSLILLIALLTARKRLTRVTCSASVVFLGWIIFRFIDLIALRGDPNMDYRRPHGWLNIIWWCSQAAPFILQLLLVPMAMWFVSRARGKTAKRPALRFFLWFAAIFVIVVALNRALYEIVMPMTDSESIFALLRYGGWWIEAADSMVEVACAVFLVTVALGRLSGAQALTICRWAAIGFVAAILYRHAEITWQYGLRGPIPGLAGACIIGASRLFDVVAFIAPVIPILAWRREERAITPIP